MAYYNLSNVTEATNVYEMSKGVNQLTQGFYGVSILLAFWFILFLAFKRQGYDTGVALLSVNFISLLVCILLYFIDFVPQQSITAMLALTGITLFIQLFRER